MNELHHISDGDLDRYHFDAIRGPELAMVEEHLLWCLHCQRREEENWRSMREKRRAHLGHITTDDLELYQLGRMTDAADCRNRPSHQQSVATAHDRMLAIEQFVKLVRAGLIRAGWKSYDHFFIPAQDFRRY